MATEKRLFDKKEAIKLLRGKCVGKYPSTFVMGLFAAADEIAKLTDVDAVEVVRCKDCKHWHEETGWCYYHSHFIDSKGGACHPWESNDWKMLDEDDFCSYGERRTDGLHRLGL
jgi:hypothetical protein